MQVRYTHVVNVSALEGKFAVGNKSTAHPHTNMARRLPPPPTAAPQTWPAVCPRAAAYGPSRPLCRLASLCLLFAFFFLHMQALPEATQDSSKPEK